MAKNEWFRRTSWSNGVAQDFETRLGRCRTSYNKAQYLKIQALTLLEAEDRLLVVPALELLSQLLAEFPDESQLEHAHLLTARCHEQQGDLGQAMEHFRLALSAQLIYPNSDAGTSLEYPWFVVHHGIKDLYDDALQTLNTARLAFPVQFFKAAAIRAQVAESRDDGNTASRYAAEALAAAAQTQSQFQFHQSLGLVDDFFIPVVNQLRRIASQP